MQLWRLHLLDHPGESNPVLRVWADRVRELPVEARTGPQYIVARGYQNHHDYDRAALGFLWCPLMAPADKPLAAMSLVEAIRCLKLAGRFTEARQMTHELKTKFGDTSAATTYLAAEAKTSASKATPN